MKKKKFRLPRKTKKLIKYLYLYACSDKPIRNNLLKEVYHCNRYEFKYKSQGFRS